MPKKKEEYSDDEFIDDEEEDVPKKKPAAKGPKGPPRKKKAADSPGDEPKPKKPKAKPVTETFTAPDGYTIRPPSLIYKADPEAQGGTKIAAIDLDGTLVVTKSGMQFPKDGDDWQWFNANVPGKLRELVSEGYQLVIISNQGGIKAALDGAASNNVRRRVDGLLAEARKAGPLPCQVFFATKNDELRKPEPGMWEFFVANCNKGVVPDKSQSFYCGDMAGREGDKEKTDREFASNVGIDFKTPEDLFGAREELSANGPNAALAGLFKQLADRSKAAGDNPFKVQAYAKVADILAAFPDAITDAKQVAKEKGVGKSSLAKIKEYLETGTIAGLEGGAQAGDAVAPKDATALKFL